MMKVNTHFYVIVEGCEEAPNGTTEGTAFSEYSLFLLSSLDKGDTEVKITSGEGMESLFRFYFFKSKD